MAHKGTNLRELLPSHDVPRRLWRSLSTGMELVLDS
jgi:hypothetical protein